MNTLLSVSSHTKIMVSMFVIVSFLVNTSQVSAQIPDFLPPPVAGVPSVLSQPADDSKIMAPQPLPVGSVSPPTSPQMTENRTFMTEKTVRPDSTEQPSVVYVYLYPEWMAPVPPPVMTPPPMVFPPMYSPAPPWMLPPQSMSPAMLPMMFPPQLQMTMGMAPPLMMTPPVATGCFGGGCFSNMGNTGHGVPCFGKNCFGTRMGQPMVPQAMEYPNPALLAADPYHATQFTPSVVAPPMVVYPNGVIIKPKVYLPGKFCHNFFQAITP